MAQNNEWPQQQIRDIFLLNSTSFVLFELRMSLIGVGRHTRTDVSFDSPFCEDCQLLNNMFLNFKWSMFYYNLHKNMDLLC